MKLSSPVYRNAIAFGFFLACLLLFLRLGVWQLERAEQKKTILMEQKITQEKSIIELPSLTTAIIDNPQAHIARQVQSSVTLLPDSLLLLDNQSYRQRAGYRAMAFFQLVNTSYVVLADMGWLPNGDSREQVITLGEISIPKKLIGRLIKPTAKPLFWKEEFPLVQQKRWQYLPIRKIQRDIAKQHQLILLPLVLQLSEAVIIEGAINQPVVVAPFLNEHQVNKHTGYAIQWFALAALVLVISILWLFNTIVKKKYHEKK